ncbi:hypothetical protein, partial [Alicyclobacillus macrosporangiidus]|uniref:hypothetical protein n=1 Tax=Alicyclobacillus macrosporangiidus TaxID=392015 RepID=UPI001C31D701
MNPQPQVPRQNQHAPDAIRCVVGDPQLLCFPGPVMPSETPATDVHSEVDFSVLPMGMFLQKPPCPFGAQHYDENVVVVVYWWVIVIQHEAK